MEKYSVAIGMIQLIQHHWRAQLTVLLKIKLFHFSVNSIPPHRNVPLSDQSSCPYIWCVNVYVEGSTWT